MAQQLQDPRPSSRHPRPRHGCRCRRRCAETWSAVQVVRRFLPRMEMLCFTPRIARLSVPRRSAKPVPALSGRVLRSARRLNRDARSQPRRCRSRSCGAGTRSGSRPLSGSTRTSGEFASASPPAARSSGAARSRHCARVFSQKICATTLPPCAAANSEPETRALASASRRGHHDIAYAAFSASI